MILNRAYGGLLLRISIGIILLATTSLAGGGNVLTVSNSGDTINGSIAYGPAMWNSTNFPGLVIKETLNVMSISGRTIGKDQLIYSTEGESRYLKVVEIPYSKDAQKAIMAGLEQFGDGSMAQFAGNYTLVGWQGEKYIAVKNKPYKLAKLLFEHGAAASDNKTLTVGESWEIGGGYSLTANAIDATSIPIQVWLSLSKDGVKKDDKVVNESKPVYTYVEASVCGENDVPVFVTYVDSVFTVSTAHMVRLRYTWLMNSTCTEVKSGDVFGVMKVTDTNPLTLMNSETALTLSRGSTINLMDNLYFRINDSDNLEYYPMMTNVTPTIPSSSIELSGNVNVLWNTTIQDGLSSTHSNSEDYDGDGAPEIIGYSRDKSKMYLISGRNGTKLWETVLGFNILYAGEYSVNDLDSDGGKDFVAVTKNYPNYNQSLIILNGRSGEVLWNKSGNEMLELGDISGDSKNDLLLKYDKSDWGYGKFHTNLSAVRGFDGLELWNRSYSSDEGLYVGQQIAGDLDRDGRQDVIVVEYSPSLSSVEALSGSSGSLIWNKTGEYKTVPAGDLSGDGYADIIIMGGNDTIAVRGYDGAQLWIANGWPVTLLNDINADNKRDLIVEKQNILGNKQLTALSGSDGSQLWKADLEVQSEGVAGIPVKDLNGDGKEDIIALTYNDWQAYPDTPIYIFGISGSDGSIMWKRPFANTPFGLWLRYVGDLTGDRRDDIAINNIYIKSMDYSSVTSIM